MATRFNNSGVPQPTGIKACIRHHEKALSSYKVRKNTSLKAKHERVVGILNAMLQSRPADVLSLKSIYLGYEEVAQRNLLEIVPRELLEINNTLNEARVHQRDLRADIYPEQASESTRRRMGFANQSF